jgi:hypothetical protein
VSGFLGHLSRDRSLRFQSLRGAFRGQVQHRLIRLDGLLALASALVEDAEQGMGAARFRIGGDGPLGGGDGLGELALVAEPEGLLDPSASVVHVLA